MINFKLPILELDCATHLSEPDNAPVETVVMLLVAILRTVTEELGNEGTNFGKIGIPLLIQCFPDEQCMML